jgi:hypothetical protein
MRSKAAQAFGAEAISKSAPSVAPGQLPEFQTGKCHSNYLVFFSFTLDFPADCQLIK